MVKKKSLLLCQFLVVVAYTELTQSPCQRVGRYQILCVHIFSVFTIKVLHQFDEDFVCEEASAKGETEMGRGSF